MINIEWSTHPDVVQFPPQEKATNPPWQYFVQEQQLNKFPNPW